MLGTLRLPGFSFSPLRAVLWLVALVESATSSAWACNVPVFRYALERWQPDPYHLTIFHVGDGEAALESALESLKKRPLRLHAEAVNLDLLEADDWRLEGVKVDREKLPWAVLRYPPRPGRTMQVIWSGAWNTEALEFLSNSPMRQEIVRRILLGESAVWVLVECGNAEKDKAAKECFQRELTEVKQKLHIPGTEELDYLPTDSDTPSPEVLVLQEPTEAIPLKIEFSLLSLSRDDVNEQTLLAMLLNLEPDLHEYAKEPMAFPIFGQARALWALVGAGINAENILESCGFLTGACSCQVKHMNPGTDLLIEFDWPGALEGRVPPPPEITPEMLTAVVPRLEDDEEQSRPAGDSDADHAGTNDRCPVAHSPADDGAFRTTSTEVSDTPLPGTSLFVITGAVVGGLLLVVAGATVVLLGRKRP